MFKTIIAWFTSILVAICGFFGGLFGTGKKPVDPTPPPTTAIVQPSEPATEAPTEPETEAPTEPEKPAPQTFNVTLTSLQALGLDEQTTTVSTVNSIGVGASYDIVGVLVKDVLEALGADMQALDSSSTLYILPSDGPTNAATYTYAQMMGNRSFIALAITAPAKNASDPPRSFIDGELAGLAVKNIATLVLTY